MNKRLTLLLVSYDGYSDMWPTFFECKEKFWPDCPYPIVLANNEKDFAASNLKVLNCGKEAQWSTRTRMALENIDTKYVMFLLEDLFISDKVKTEHIEGALDLMDKDGIDYYKIKSFSSIDTVLYKKIPYLHVIPQNLRYGISLQAAIWDKDFFKQKIGEGNYNPWYFEAERNRESSENSESEKMVGLYDNRNILNICHMVVQGKYLPNAVKYMLAKDIQIDTTQRSVMPLKQLCNYKFKLFVLSIARRIPVLYKIVKSVGFQSVSEKNSQKCS